jgi:hypothetical protein
LHKIEAATKVERRQQVVRAEHCPRDSELIRIYILAVDRDDVSDTRIVPFRSPCAVSGADIEQAGDSHLAKEKPGHRLRRAPRASVDIVVEIARILMFAHHSPDLVVCPLPTAG